MKRLLLTVVFALSSEQRSADIREEKSNNRNIPAEGYRFIFVSFLSALLFLCTTSAMAQITGATSLCAGATTALTDITVGGKWSSSNTAIAVVDVGTGLVSGITAGTATISYIFGVTVTLTLTVNPLPNAGAITGANSVCIGSTITLSDPATGGAWSANNAIASAGTSGIVTGVTAGTDTIKYTVTNSCGSVYAATNITVNGIIGDIYTHGGTGTAGFSGDGGPAFLATMSNPRDLITDTAGNVYVCDVLNNRVRRISKSGIITTIAGNGTAGNTGDGGQATAAALRGPNGIFVDNSGNIFISNTASNTIRKINASGVITTIAGITGSPGWSGDGGPATAAMLHLPLGLIEDASGDIYIADQQNNEIRKITTATGIITSVAGTGVAGYSGDGGPATAAMFSTVRGLAMDGSGNIYIADANNNVIRKYVPSTGIITTFAGTGVYGHTGDGGPATAATLSSPARFAYDGSNILYITDQDNSVIRQVNMATGIISQVAGNATIGYGGDGGVADSAQLNTPSGIAVDHSGKFYISDASNNRIRLVPTRGSISTHISGATSICAGTPVTMTAFFSGSGSPSYQWQKNGSNVGSGGTAYTNPSPADGDVYRVIVTITPACSASFSDTSNNITVTVSTAVTVSAVTSNVSCNGGGNGSVTTSVSGGNPSYTYLWSTGATTANLSTLAANSYSVTVTDTHGCTATGSYTVTQPAALAVTASVINNVSCNGLSDGSATTTVTGGTSTYAYLWSTGVTTSSLPGKAAGTYSVTVTDAHGCIATGSTVITQPAVLSTTASTTANVSCNGSADGVVTTATTGGTTAYAYLWSNSATTASPSGLAPGTYSVTVTDSHGCKATSAATVTQPSALSITASTVNNVSCNGGANGSMTTTATGGTTAYTYLWSNGATTTSVSGIVSGTYSVTVTDAHGCKATNSTTVTQPAALSVTPAVTNVTCNGLTNGSITTTTAGGTPTYTFLWSTGVTTTGISGKAAGTYTLTVTDGHSCTAVNAYAITQPAVLSLAGAVAANVTCHGASNGSITTNVTGGTTAYAYLWSTGSTATNLTALAPATYSVTVTDAHSCTATGSYTITQPAVLAISGSSITNAACNTNGSVSITVSGGTTLYTYLWSNGATTAGITTGAGTYSVTVTDAHGCTVTGSPYTILPFITVTPTITNVSCNGATNGSITTSVSGGKNPYSYSWNTGGTGSGISSQAAGTYTLTVTDNKSCVVINSYTITQPAAITVTPAITNVLCNGGSTGGITATASGGTPSYTYLWNTGATTLAITGKAAGTYSVTVTDSKGCKGTSVNDTIAQPAAISVSASISNATSCGSHDGKINTTVTGGTPAYTYAWSNGATTADLGSPLTAGIYTVTVTDANGCNDTTSFTVHSPCFKTGSNPGGDENAGAIRVYPNPTIGAVNIEIPVSDKEGLITIADITGRIITARTVAANNSAPVTFDMSGYASGLYIVKVSLNGTNYVGKFVKE